MPVAVIISTRDRPALLERALATLVPCLRPGDDAIVVDSASSDDSVARTAAAAGLRSIRVARPGLSVARNAGVAATTAPLLAFTDDDCEVREGWTSGIERAFEDPTVGFVTGRAEGDSSVRLPTSLMVEPEPRRLYGYDDPSRYAVGANMALRRAAFDGVGGFDEHLGVGARLRAGEDHDMLWRLSRKGWVGVYDPSLVVVHRQWRSTSQALRSCFGYGIGAGAFAVKAIRLHDHQGWALLRSRLLGEGILEAGRLLRAGAETGAAATLLAAAGVLVGALRAARTPLVNGRFGS